MPNIKGPTCSYGFTVTASDGKLDIDEWYPQSRAARLRASHLAGLDIGDTGMKRFADVYVWRHDGTPFSNTFPLNPSEPEPCGEAA